MPASLTTLSAILKEIYEPRINKQLNDEAVAIKRVERSSDGIKSEVGGKYVVFPLHTRRNQGIGARNEMEALPTPGQQGYTSGRSGLKYLYGGIRLSGQALRLANKDYQAFASAVKEEMNGLKSDLAVDQNRMVYGDGTGALAVITADGASTATVQTAQWLQQGAQVDIIDGTTITNASPTKKATNRQVTGIDTAANTFTYDGGDIAAASGDIVVRTGSVNREWNGFSSIIKDSGTIFNIDPTVEPLWKSVIRANGGTNRAISEGLMTELVDTIRANGGKVTAIFTNLGVRRAYVTLLKQQQQFVNTTKFDGGFTGFSFATDGGEIPVVVDTMAPKNRMYFVNEKELTLYREADWSFMDYDGSMWDRVAGFDAYDAMMFQYSELVTHRRNTHGLLADITEG